jgi:hypothetical protein
MATVRLSRAELDALPPVCVCCGAPAAAYQPERFHWLPWWSVFLLLGATHAAHLIVALHRVADVRLPFCPEHTAYRTERRQQAFRPLLRAVAASGLVLFAGALVLGILQTANVIGPREAFRMTLGGLAAAAVPVVAAGLRALWLAATGVRVTNVSDRALTLRGVAEEFAQAVRSRREQKGD